MKKSFSFVLAASAMLFGAMVFTSCEKDEELISGKQQNNATNSAEMIQTTVQQVNDILAPYDFHELQPLAEYLVQNKSAKGPVSDWFNTQRDNIRTYNAEALARLTSLVKNLIPNYNEDNPYQNAGHFTDRSETFTLAWELTTYLTRDARYKDRYDTLIINVNDTTTYTITANTYDNNRLTTALDDNKSIVGNNSRILSIKLNGEEIVSIIVGFDSNIAKSGISGTVYGNLLYQGLNVEMNVSSTNFEDYDVNINVRTIENNESTEVIGIKALVLPEGSISNRNYSANFQLNLMGDMASLKGNISNLKTFASDSKELMSMMQEGAEQSECDETVNSMNGNLSIELWFGGSRQGDVYFASKANAETGNYNPVMMARMTGLSDYPLTLEELLNGMGIDLSNIFNKDRQ